MQIESDDVFFMLEIHSARGLALFVPKKDKNQKSDKWVRSCYRFHLNQVCKLWQYSYYYRCQPFYI